MRGVNVELTTFCNLACNICPHKSVIKTPAHMPLSLLKTVLEKSIPMVDHATVFTLVGLGEPLLYPQFEEAIQLVKTQYPSNTISLNTNALLLDHDKSEMLLNNLSENDIIVFSLNADSKETYQIFTGSGKYAVALGNVKAFLEKRRKRASSCITILRFLESPQTSLSKFQSLWQPYIDRGVQINSHKFLNWGGLIDAPAKNQERRPCLALWSAICFDVNGNFYPCCEALGATREKSSLYLGNLDRDDLSETYHGKIFTFRDQHLHNVWVGDCEKCDFWVESS